MLGSQLDLALKRQLSSGPKIWYVRQISYGLEESGKTPGEWLERPGLGWVRYGLVLEFPRRRQAFAVARAFHAHRLNVLLLDEPFTALDDRAPPPHRPFLQSAAGGSARKRTDISLDSSTARRFGSVATPLSADQRGLRFIGANPQIVDDLVCACIERIERTELVLIPVWRRTHCGQGLAIPISHQGGRLKNNPLSFAFSLVILLLYSVSAF